MNPNQKAWWHLGFVGMCLLVADQLPQWHKLWFVSETGHYHTSSTITVLLLLSMFLRRRPSLGLMVAWQMVQLFIIGSVLLLSFPDGNYVFGFSLLGFLRLIALGVIFFSAELNRYVRYKPTDTTSAM
ncbi:hypothetical protein [Hymenobacter crusticola]|uniref:Uncharacterized protein n=1 Tax=Hymenobacter crusticola TaxID=1770526 RepID=A0A243WGW4_9BACT|nr:hypothetical protein [Hymenobacter crusticola]OUJ75081.1 hypothetical protein BXP70_03375 [Hymenobacter crusticola]